MTRCSAKRITHRGAEIQPDDHVCDSYRIVECGYCGRELRVCRCCDHGQVYCPDGKCAESARIVKIRGYRADHQQSKSGRRSHAKSQARYRLRRELALMVGTQKVTDHPSTNSSSSETVASTFTKEEEHEPDKILFFDIELVRCDLCGRLCRPFMHRWSFW